MPARGDNGLQIAVAPLDGIPAFLLGHRVGLASTFLVIASRTAAARTLALAITVLSLIVVVVTRGGQRGGGLRTIAAVAARVCRRRSSQERVERIGRRSGLIAVGRSRSWSGQYDGQWFIAVQRGTRGRVGREHGRGGCTCYDDGTKIG